MTFDTSVQDESQHSTILYASVIYTGDRSQSIWIDKSAIDLDPTNIKLLVKCLYSQCTQFYPKKNLLTPSYVTHDNIKVCVVNTVSQTKHNIGLPANFKQKVRSFQTASACYKDHCMHAYKLALKTNKILIQYK